MRCLVTGVAGFIGSTLAERLVRDGHEVRGVDCFTDYYPRARKESHLLGLRGSDRFTLHEIDLGSAPLAELIEGVDVVFHQAAQAGVRASWGALFESYTHHNVLATQRILEAVKLRADAGSPIQKLVYASSSSVYGQTEDLPMRETSYPRPFSPYGVTKLAAEHLAELYRNNFGVPTVSLRYFTVYGPRQRPDMGFTRFITALRDGKSLPIFGDGEQTRDFTFVGDIVEANVRAAESAATGVYNLGGGSRVSLNHVLETLGEVMGAKITRDVQGPMAGDVRHTYADTTRARADLGFDPKTSLREGLAAQVAWFDAERSAGRL